MLRRLLRFLRDLCLWRLRPDLFVPAGVELMVYSKEEGLLCQEGVGETDCSVEKSCKR